MKKIYILMIAVMFGVMLTACGSASITPEIPFDYSTDGIVDINDLPAYPTKPTDLTGSGFLAETADGFNTTDIHDGHEIPKPSVYWRAGEDSKNPDGYVLFGTSILKAFPRPQGMSDGQLIIEEDYRAIDSRSYVGILSTTNLGAPLTETPATAVWPGYFGGGVIRRDEITDFYVDFEAGRFGFYNEADKEIGTKDIFYGGFLGRGESIIHTLNGYFGNHPNAKGLNPGQMVGNFIFNPGSIAFFDYREATLTGLIGEEGAVGVFTEVGKIGSDSSIILTGGFTATNPDYTPPAGLPDPCADGIKGACVDYADWADSFLTPPPTAPNTTPENQFLSGDAIVLIDAVDAGNFSLIKSLNLKDTFNRKTHNPTVLDGSENSGVVYFRDPVTSYYYAGLLSGTNLGAPLVEESGNAKWVGRFFSSRDRFTLEIDFTKKKIEAFIIGNHLIDFYHHIIGDYDAKGVITGIVNYGRFDADTRKPIEGEPQYPAVLTGLIGQNGAVGAFISGTGDKSRIISSADNFNYAGGFVAHPYGN